MQSTRFFATLSTVVAFFAFATAAATPLKPRHGIVDIEQVLAGAQAQVAGLVGQVTSLSAADNLSTATLSPLLSAVISKVNFATSQVHTLVAAGASGQTDLVVEDVATQLGPVIDQVNFFLAPVVDVASTVPGVAPALLTLNLATAGLLSSVESLSPGALSLVGGPLSTLTTTVNSVYDGVGLGSVLSSFGIGSLLQSVGASDLLAGLPLGL